MTQEQKPHTSSPLNNNIKLESWKNQGKNDKKLFLGYKVNSNSVYAW